MEEWDSLNQIKLIIGCEKAFDIRLKPREINGLQNVGEMVDHLVRHFSGT
ncbi:MAG: acyl carrier protein [Alphaproteobacteria bacterium]|nr:acyl carrier protein [Alphaproteobacteria bacterium]